MQPDEPFSRLPLASQESAIFHAPYYLADFEVNYYIIGTETFRTAG